MQLSIRRLATILIVLLISVTIVTTGAGLYALQTNYRSLEDRHEAEAHDTIRNAVIAVSNQVRFYQGIVQQVAANTDVVNLLEFADHPEIANWSASLGRLLPGTLGTALASPDGVVFGDPLAQRVGPTCQSDMADFAAGGRLDYPLLHADVPGQEHFDLISRVTSPTGGQAGTLFVSFRLGVISELLQHMTRDGDRFLLFDRRGSVQLATGEPIDNPDAREYRLQVPDTSWELVLRRPLPEQAASLTTLVVIDTLSLLAVGLLIVYLVRGTLARFTIDLARIHAALSDVLEGRYRPSSAPTAIRETGILLPDIEQLALRIQRQRDDLRHQSLSDPLTGVFNRRYFDLMLTHLHEQSHRQPPAALVVVDLNDFKEINDRFGHRSGDRVLQNTAEYLRGRVRSSDIVARLGGDEFALILTQMANTSLEDWLAALVHDHDHQLRGAGDDDGRLCQFSAGAARIDATRYATAEDVYNAADSAMYEVKQRRQVLHSRYAVARGEGAAPATSVRAAP